LTFFRPLKEKAPKNIMANKPEMTKLNEKTMEKNQMKYKGEGIENVSPLAN